MQRLFAPERTREELRALINGDLGTAEGRSDLIRLALRLIVEEALEGEVSDPLGRERYERGEGEKAGYLGRGPIGGVWRVQAPPAAGALLSGDVDRGPEGLLGEGGIRGIEIQQDFAAEAMDEGEVAPIVALTGEGQRIVDGQP